VPKVKYVGDFPAVDLVHDDGRTETVEKNHEVEVSASDRDSLVKQGDNWTEIKRSAPDPKPDPTPSAPAATTGSSAGKE